MGPLAFFSYALPESSHIHLSDGMLSISAGPDTWSALGLGAGSVLQVDT